MPVTLLVEHGDEVRVMPDAVATDVVRIRPRLVPNEASTRPSGSELDHESLRSVPDPDLIPLLPDPDQIPLRELAHGLPLPQKISFRPLRGQGLYLLADEHSPDAVHTPQASLPIEFQGWVDHPDTTWLPETPVAAIDTVQRFNASTPARVVTAEHTLSMGELMGLSTRLAALRSRFAQRRMDDAELGATASTAEDPGAAETPGERVSDDQQSASSGRSSGLLGAIETLFLGDREAEVPLETQYKLPEDYLATFKDERANYRTTLRWLLTAYGAIGTVLVAGLSFTSLHDLNGGDLWLALVGASFALGSVAAVVVVTARATVSVPVKYAEIAAPPKRSVFGPITGNPVRFLHEMFRTGEGNLLRDAFNDDIIQFNEAYQDGKHPDNELATALARGGLTVLVSYHAMRYRFRVATRLIFVAVLGVAIGVVLFAYAAGAGDAQTTTGDPPATASEALAVELSLTDDGQAILTEALGSGNVCWSLSSRSRRLGAVVRLMLSPCLTRIARRFGSNLPRDWEFLSLFVDLILRRRRRARFPPRPHQLSPVLRAHRRVGSEHFSPCPSRPPLPQRQMPLGKFLTRTTAHNLRTGFRA